MRCARSGPPSAATHCSGRLKTRITTHSKRVFHYTRGASDISAGYTCAKSIDQSSNLGEAVNPFDLRYTRAISAFDVNTISFHHVQIRDPSQAAVWPRKPVDRKLVHFRRYTIQHRFARDALQRSRRFAAGDKSKWREQSVSGRAAIHAATAGTQ